MRWMIASDHSRQYDSGKRRCSYQVVPCKRVRPSASAINRNSPACETRKFSRCGGWMSKGDHSFIGGGLEVTENARRLGSSHAVIGSMKAPVENSQRRMAPTPLPLI